jgi:hypothetical protein
MIRHPKEEQGGGRAVGFTGLLQSDAGLSVGLRAICSTKLRVTLDGLLELSRCERQAMLGLQAKMRLQDDEGS